MRLSTFFEVIVQNKIFDTKNSTFAIRGKFKNTRKILRYFNFGVCSIYAFCSYTGIHEGFLIRQ